MEVTKKMEKQKHQKKSDYRFKNGILYKNKEPISEWGTPRKYRYPYIIFTPQNNKVSGLFAGQTIDTNRINQTYLPTQSKATLPPHLQRICKAEHRIKQIDDNDFDYPETEADKKDPEVQAFKREKTQAKTPQSAKDLFKDFLFPCDLKKNPVLEKGKSWSVWAKDNSEKWIKNTKKVIRSITSRLCGLDCGQANLVVVDIDQYKEDFKQSKEAQAFLKECLKRSQFVVKTPRGGLHIFFKQPKAMIIGCPKPYDGVEIKGRGGYVCSYGLPFNPDAIECNSYEAFYNNLPEFPYGDFSNHTTKTSESEYEFGEGKNNRAVISHASRSALSGGIDQATNSIIKMFSANANRTWDKHKYTKDFLTNLIKKWKPNNAQLPQTDLKLRLHKKTKIKDIIWRVPQWIEQGFCLIAGLPGTGKSTLAIYIAVKNALKEPFWEGGPKGDGRKSLYICFERQKNKAYNKEIACGGDGNQIDIANDMIDSSGESVSIDLEDDMHLNIILNLIIKNNYAFVIFDPAVDLVLSNQNDNAKVRKAFNKIFKQTENINTTLLGIAHLRKERQQVDELGSIRSASELPNLANAVLKIRELKDDQGYLIYRLKVNEGKQIKKGAIKYKLEDCEIPKKYLAEGSKEDKKGGIKNLRYVDKPVAFLKKDCEDDIPNPNKESYFDKIKRVIDRRIAEGKALDTTIIRKLSIAEGVSKYYFQKTVNWTEFGYEEEGNGKFGAEYRILLKKIK